MIVCRRDDLESLRFPKFLWVSTNHIHLSKNSNILIGICTINLNKILGVSRINVVVSGGWWINRVKSSIYNLINFQHFCQIMTIRLK